jgi:predicted component of type VI protein secretion system
MLLSPPRRRGRFRHPNSLYLPCDKAVVCKHARVHRQDKRFYVTDLHSPNGTRIDGAQLPPGAAVPIDKGAKIQVGQVVVELL